MPISPTTVVPRWALRERAAPLMASTCAPRGLRSSLGSVPPFSERQADADAGDAAGDGGEEEG